MNKKGITMIELIVVMVIIAIGATLMVPSIGRWLPTYRLKGATRDIVSVMRVAQFKAVSTNTWYRVSFNPGSNSYILQHQGSGGVWVDEGEVQAIPKGVQINNTTFAGNVAIFYPNSTATAGTVTITNAKGSQKTIQLWGTTGRVKHG